MNTGYIVGGVCLAIGAGGIVYTLIKRRAMRKHFQRQQPSTPPKVVTKSRAPSEPEEDPVQIDLLRGSTTEENVYLKALSKTHYDTIVKCGNCGGVSIRYIQKGVNISTVPCHKCAVKGLLPVDRTNLTRGFFDGLEVVMPEITEETVHEIERELPVPKTGAALRRSKLFR